MKPGQDRIVSHTDAEWTAMDPVLADGEIGINRNGGRMKYGDGVTPWSALPYLDQNYARQGDIEAVASQLAQVALQVDTVATQVDTLAIQMTPAPVTPTTTAVVGP